MFFNKHDAPRDEFGYRLRSMVDTYRKRAEELKPKKAELIHQVAELQAHQRALSAESDRLKTEGEDPVADARRVAEIRMELEASETIQARLGAELEEVNRQISGLERNANGHEVRLKRHEEERSGEKTFL